MNRLVEALRSGRVLLMDGAMGTELQRLGLTSSEPADLWNLTHPKQVCAVHRAYLEAGAEVLVTNTFQANPAALTRHGLHDRMGEIWKAALNNATTFQIPPPFVLADIGPIARKDLPQCWPPHDICWTADGLLLETWNVFELLGLGTGNLANHPELPLLVSFTFRKDPNWNANLNFTLRRIDGLHPIALGVNCGVEIDMDDMLEITRCYRQLTDLPLFVRPNAGTPRRTASGWEYPRSPETMADKLWPLLEAGVTMVGGCCGTTPAHIAAFRRVVDEWNARKT